MDHGGMDMGGDQCSMNVGTLLPQRMENLLNLIRCSSPWDTDNLCIVFRQWRITGVVSLLLSLVAIALLAAGYECVREISRKYEQSHSARMNAFSSGASSTSSPSTSFVR